MLKREKKIFFKKGSNVQIILLPTLAILSYLRTDYSHALFSRSRKYKIYFLLSKKKFLFFTIFNNFFFLFIGSIMCYYFKVRF